MLNLTFSEHSQKSTEIVHRDYYLSELGWIFGAHFKVLRQIMYLRDGSVSTRFNRDPRKRAFPQGFPQSYPQILGISR
jgi:hypothetical protein